MQVSDITKVVGPKTFERPIYAGNAIQTVESSDAEDRRDRAHRFVPGDGRGRLGADRGGRRGGRSGRVVLRRRGARQVDRPELTSAKIIISGGRAMQKAENFKT